MTCSQFHDQLDQYLDGDAELEPSAAQLKAHAAACERCAAEWNLALCIRHTLGEMPAPACPDPVFEAALERIALLDRNSRSRPPVRRAARSHRYATFVFSSLAVLLLAVSVVLLRPVEPTYSDEEIAEARRQVEFAFALVGETGRSTGLFLHDVMLTPDEATPRQRRLPTP